MQSRGLKISSPPQLVRRLLAVVAVAGAATLPYSASSSATAGVLSGTVFHDVNNNGLRDVGEVGIPGVVVNAFGPAVVTDIDGHWTMNVAGKDLKVRVSTGWYRSQCDGLNCSAGPGADNDFEVINQFITATVDGTLGATVDVGLLPDWPGDYPIPAAPVPANEVDVATRLSWIWPSNPGNCFRTTDARHHACAAGDTPSGALQVSNEGTVPLTGIAGFIEVPPNTTILPAVASSSPGNSPDITDFIIGPIDPMTNRAPFELIGTLQPAAAAQYILTARIEAGTPASPTPLRTSNPYEPNEMTITITNPVDPDGCLAEPCPRGQHNKQAPADNTDFHGWQVIAAIVAPVPAMADFGAIPDGTVSSMSVSLRNSGLASTSISEITLGGDAAGDYKVSSFGNCLIDPLIAGAKCDLLVAFRPTIAGLRAASLTVRSSAAPSAIIGLSGRKALPLPTITSFNPTGARPGTTVTIAGTNFSSVVNPTIVKFVGSPGIPVVPANNGTQMTVTVPADALQGTVSVTTDAGAVTSTAFVVRRAPTDVVTVPLSGAVGTVVAIKGNNFKGTTTVTFNGVSAKFTVIGPNKITATVPTTATTGTVKVTNPWGSSSTMSVFTVLPAV